MGSNKRETAPARPVRTYRRAAVKTSICQMNARVQPSTRDEGGDFPEAGTKNEREVRISSKIRVYLGDPLHLRGALGGTGIETEEEAFFPPLGTRAGRTTVRPREHRSYGMTLTKPRKSRKTGGLDTTKDSGDPRYNKQSASL